MIGIQQELVIFIVLYAVWNLCEKKQFCHTWKIKESQPSNVAHVGALRYWENRNKYYGRKERFKENWKCAVFGNCV